MDEIKLWTSYASSDVLKYFEEREILPLFIARTIKDSQLIGGWQGTPIHLPQFAPSPMLLREWKYNSLPDQEFEEQFFDELMEQDIPEVLSRIKTMIRICQAKGAVLIGYGVDPEKDHRSFLARFLGYEYNLPITEYTSW